jgi:hypothetical protein
MYFDTKNYLKSNHYHTAKHVLKLVQQVNHKTSLPDFLSIIMCKNYFK